jgi:hypothetical protein
MSGYQPTEWLSEGQGAMRCGLVWAQGGRAGMTIGTKVVVWASARART